MRRLEAFTLVLAALLTLSACGGEESPDRDVPPAGAGEPDFVLYDCGGLEAALPARYLDQLYVETDFSDAEASWKPLISVYEKLSYETAMEEYGGGGGFLFGLLVMNQAAFEQHISSDGSGISVFATDGEKYYAYTYPTDVQFCRPGGEIDTQSEDWTSWEELNEIGPAVRDDFLTRNGLQSFTVRDFADRLAAEAGDHVCVRYYPYFIKDGDTRIYYQLLLRQPARQGEGGIWAVDQWMDAFGSQYLYFPDSGLPAAEYYAQIQEECAAGKHPEYLTPAGAAAAFAKDFFGHETVGGSFEAVPAVDQGYMERNLRLENMMWDIMYGRGVDDLELLECVGEATADNWGVLGRHMYGSDWFQPLMDAVSDASVGEDQQARDKAVLSFYLAVDGARTDFHGPLSGILRAQRNMDPDAYQAALDEFSQADRDFLLGAVFGVQRAPSGGEALTD